VIIDGAIIYRAIGKRGYTNKTHLRGLKIEAFESDFQSAKADFVCVAAISNRPVNFGKFVCVAAISNR